METEIGTAPGLSPTAGPSTSMTTTITGVPSLPTSPITPEFSQQEQLPDGSPQHKEQLFISLDGDEQRDNINFSDEMSPPMGHTSASSNSASPGGGSSSSHVDTRQGNVASSRRLHLAATGRLSSYR